MSSAGVMSRVQSTLDNLTAKSTVYLVSIRPSSTKLRMMPSGMLVSVDQLIIFSR